MDPRTEIDDEFARYFRKRGLHVAWDFDKRSGDHWYELYDDGGLVCQVDFGTPLSEFIADIPHFIAGRPGVGLADYECRCPDLTRLRAIYERISA
jgi:hypothetical protein